MGAGKTSVGRVMSWRLEVPFYDTDEDVEAEAGCPIACLWNEQGEPVFREMEAAAVQRVAGYPPGVVATGGGVVLDRHNVAAMRSAGVVAWLRAPADELSRRVAGGDERPLLADGETAQRLDELLDARSDRYREAADFVIDTAGRTPEDVATEIEALWIRS